MPRARPRPRGPIHLTPTQAVQRHRATIVECVKDADVSIRRRALELVYSLVNESNIRTLTRELLDYLAVSDAEFKPDLTAKICMLIQRWGQPRAGSGTSAGGVVARGADRGACVGVAVGGSDLWALLGVRLARCGCAGAALAALVVLG